MRAELLELIPEFDLIKDGGLKEKVLAALRARKTPDAIQ